MAHLSQNALRALFSLAAGAPPPPSLSAADLDAVVQELEAEGFVKVTGRPRQICVDITSQGRRHVELEVLASCQAQEPASLDVARERARQISGEGWTPEHDDDTHRRGEMAAAAANYAAASAVMSALDAKGWETCPPYDGFLPFTDWPWARQSFKPVDRRRALVKAGALILAEIERIDRAGAARG
jgi:hypothetical protein